MRLTIIGASDEAIHTIECARELGIETAAMDGNPDAEGLKHADIPVTVDITNEAEVIDVVKKLGTDWIQTVPIGRYLTTTGAVNDALGLPGITKSMAEICTDKYLFHKTLSTAKLRNCICHKISGGMSSGDADTLISELFNGGVRAPEFPLILKPRYGSGSRGIMMASTEDELKHFLEDMEEISEDYVLEECLAGEEYGVDAVVADGELHLILLRYKFNTPLPDRQAVGYVSVLPADPAYAAVRDYMIRAAGAMGLDECLMHADVMMTDRGPFAIEVSARPSGHNLHNLFTPLAAGVDMAAEYMKYRMGRPYSFDPGYTKSMMIHYFDLEGTVINVPDREAVRKAVESYGGELLRWELNIRPGDELEKVTNGHSLMGRGYYIADGADIGIDGFKELAETVKGLFEMKDI